MIHVATVHWMSDEWIELQLEWLHRTISEPHRVYACLEGVHERYHTKFDVVVPAQGGHAGKLNLLAFHILDEADDDDLIVFLDGDAFPVGDIITAARTALGQSALFAIRRDENLHDPQPHPSFCVTSVRTWRTLRGDWLSGYVWQRPEGQFTDVGGNLLYQLQTSSTPWTPLLRSHQFAEHPVWFGVYGSLVYHHGAGFRPALSRFDDLDRPSPRFASLRGTRGVGPLLKRLNARRDDRWAERRIARVGEESDSIRRRLHDPRSFEDLFAGRTGRPVAPLP